MTCVCVCECPCNTDVISISRPQPHLSTTSHYPKIQSPYQTKMPPPIRPLIRLLRPSTLRPFTTSPLHLTPSSNNSLRPTANLPQQGGNDPRAVFSELDVLSGLPPPASAIESVYPTGFLLNNTQRISGDGVFLINNDVFRWRPFPTVKDTSMKLEGEKARVKGVIELPESCWGILDVVQPKPGMYNGDWEKGMG